MLNIQPAKRYMYIYIYILFCRARTHYNYPYRSIANTHVFHMHIHHIQYLIHKTFFSVFLLWCAVLPRLKINSSRKWMGERWRGVEWGKWYTLEKCLSKHLKNKLCVCDIVGSVTYTINGHLHRRPLRSVLLFRMHANECIPYYVANRGKRTKKFSLWRAKEMEKVKREHL